MQQHRTPRTPSTPSTPRTPSPRITSAPRAAGAILALVRDGSAGHRPTPRARPRSASPDAVRRFLDDSGLDLTRMHARLISQPLGREIDPGFADRLVAVLHMLETRAAELGLPRLELAASDVQRLARRLRASRSTVSSATVTVLGDLLASLDDQLLVIANAGGELFLDADTSLRRAQRSPSARHLTVVTG